MNIVKMDNDYCTVEDNPVFIKGSICEIYSHLVKKTLDYISENEKIKKAEKEREVTAISNVINALSQSAICILRSK